MVPLLCFIIRRLWLPIALCSVISPAFSNDRPIISVSGAAAQYRITYPLFLEDSSRKLTIDQVLKEPHRFQKSRQPVVTLGVSSSALWIYFEVRNDSPHNNWHLEIKSPPILHEIGLYTIDSTGQPSLIKASGDENYAQRFVKVNTVLLPLSLPPGTQKAFYLRVTGNNILGVPLRIGTLQGIYESNHRRDVTIGLVCGILIAFLLYNLFVYFSLRENTYLYYVGYIFSWTLNLFFYEGYLIELTGDTPIVNNACIITSSILLFSVGFTNSFLQTHKHAPLAYRLRWPMVLIALTPAIISLAGYDVEGFMAVQFVMYPMFIYWMTAAIMSLRKGYKPTYYFIAGFGAIILGSAVYNMKDNGLLPSNFVTEFSVQWATVTEAIILSYALAGKINFYKKAKERTQQLALEQAMAFSRQLVQAQEKERKRIAAELHDSVGQKLVLIKNKALLQKNSAQGEIPAYVDTIGEVIEEIRSISYYLRPYQIDLLGLTKAIEGLIEDTMDATDIHIESEIASIDKVFDKEEEMNIYRIIQECLNNMVKHAQATECRVTVKRTTETINISITDNGRCFDPEKVQKGLGLLNLRERINMLGGHLTIRNLSPHGMSTLIVIPGPVK